MSAQVIHGDCLEVMRGMADNSVDAVVTDPPYGLSFMGRKWDYDVPSEEIWRECLRVLKPGGHLLAFAGTRTQHRMAVRIEDAGFEIRDMIAWVYGSGFPKSLDVSKAIDKAAGHGERGEGSFFTLSGGKSNGGSKFRSDHPEYVKPQAKTPAAQQWQGWGTALKPALEPITVARKPLVGTVAGNVQEWGTGALNIDGCRVSFASEEDRAAAFPGGQVTSHGSGSLAGPRAAQDARRTEFAAQRNESGRWPANLIHDGSEEVLAGFPRTAPSPSAPVRQGGKKSVGGIMNATGDDREGFGVGYGDSGSAARFFYCAKASKRDRGEGNTHNTVKPTDLMRYLCRLVTPPGGLVLDPFCGSGSTGKAALLEGFSFIGIEREREYVEIARARFAAVQPALLGVS